jgi:membrane protein
MIMGCRWAGLMGIRHGGGYRSHMTAGTARHSGGLRTAAGLWGEALRIVGSTVSICLRYRVTGLAAEVGFFALLSMPPLLLGLVGMLGYFKGVLGDETVAQIRREIVELASTALANDVVREVIVPTLDDVLKGGRFELISLGFLLSLWSGSRALNVCIDTVTIMYGLGGRRGIVKTRALSFSLYIVALVGGVFVAPLVLVGPTFVARTLPQQLSWIVGLYWPIVVLLSAAFLTTLYHVSVPVRVSWWRETPGAVLALLGWLVGSYLLRLIITASVGGTSIYGPLAAPIVLLLWLYLLAIAVLIGAAFNAAVDQRWPSGRQGEQPAEQAAPGHPHAREIQLTPVPDPSTLPAAAERRGRR